MYVFVVVFCSATSNHPGEAETVLAGSGEGASGQSEGRHHLPATLGLAAEVSAAAVTGRSGRHDGGQGERDECCAAEEVWHSCEEVDRQ